MVSATPHPGPLLERGGEGEMATPDDQDRSVHGFAWWELMLSPDPKAQELDHHSSIRRRHPRPALG